MKTIESQIRESATLRPFRITLPRAVMEVDHRAVNAQRPTGEFRQQVSVVYAMTLAEAWAMFNDARGGNDSLKRSGATIEPITPESAAA